MTELRFEEPDRPAKSAMGANLKWYPLAQIVSPHMPTRGSYADGYPRGAIVHFTAGRDGSEQEAINALSWGREQGYCYFVIGPTGIIYQSFPLDRWGYHAGESNWPGLGSGVSSKLVGIEVCCAGNLDAQYQSSFGQTYNESQARTVTESEYGCPSGTYRKFTEEQERALIELLVWLHRNNPAVFSTELILGHHEVSGKLGLGRWRKVDPGGSLSLSMPQLRKRISKLV